MKGRYRPGGAHCSPCSRRSFLPVVEISELHDGGEWSGSTSTVACSMLDSALLLVGSWAVFVSKETILGGVESPAIISTGNMLSESYELKLMPGLIGIGNGE